MRRIASSALWKCPVLVLGNSQRIVVPKSISSGNSLGFSRPLLLRFGVLSTLVVTHSGTIEKLEKPKTLPITYRGRETTVVRFVGRQREHSAGRAGTPVPHPLRAPLEGRIEHEAGRKDEAGSVGCVQYDRTTLTGHSKRGILSIENKSP